MEKTYLERAKRLEREALKLRSNTPSWKHLTTQDGVEFYYKMSPHFNGHTYKFVTTLDYPHDVVYGVMQPPKTTEERLSWDKSLKHYERLETLSESCTVGRLVTPHAAWGMISKREYIDFYVYKTYCDDDENEDYGEIRWIFAESVDHPSVPVCKEYVRGTNHPSGYAVAQNKRDPSKCFLELYNNSDIGGMIPQSLIDRALPYQQVAYIRHVKAEVKKRLKMMNERH